MKKIYVLFILSFWTLCTYAQAIHYVKENASGNGTSWSNASGNLQAVINSANEGDLIYVAEGTYIPSVVISSPGTDNREKSFVMKKNVKIYGGFAGNEMSLDQRNWEAHPTILSGNLGTAASKADNSYHVVVCVGDAGNACLDGFIIKDGNSNGATSTYTVNGVSVNKNKGGGIFMKSSSMALSNLIITENSGRDGGGLNIDQNAQPVIKDILISENTATRYGGGILISSSNSFGTLERLTVSRNNANSIGGGIYVKVGGLNLINSIVSENSAVESAGIHIESDEVSITGTLIHSNFSEYEGGGIGILGSYPAITNATIVNNYSEAGGSGIFISDGAYPEVRNSIIYNNDVLEADGEAMYFNSYVQGETIADSDGNIDGNLEPVFADIDNANFRLRISSPLLDKGDSAYIDLSTDLLNNPRISGLNVDPGAYELFTSPDSLGVLYINKNVEGGIESGQNWANAIRELSDGLIVAKNNPAVKQIWVAQGTYIPLYIQDLVNNDERSKCFFMVKDVKVYGGFTGNEASLDQRDWEANPTVLSGDIGIEGNRADDSFRVVVFAGDIGDACLDGFTIKKGNANGNLYTNSINGHSVSKISGGGMYIRNSSPKLTNLIFTENYATEGGGMYVYRSTLIIDNVAFIGNSGRYGGGINAIGCELQIYNSVFKANNVTSGGAIYINQDVNMIVENSLVEENTASDMGGGMSLSPYGGNMKINNTTIRKNTARTGGGLSLMGGITINNCIVSENRSESGGGIYCQGDTPHPLYINNTLISKNYSQGTYARGGGIVLLSCSPVITNSTIVDNFASYMGSGISVPVTTNGRPSYPEIRNTIVYNNDIHIDTGEYKMYNSYVQDLTDNDNFGNIDGSLDPQFVNINNADYRLKFTSPLVDKGNSTYLPEYLTVDLGGNARISGADVDLGAYEIRIAEPQQGVLYVNKNVVGGNGSGDSWANAKSNLADALWDLKFNNPNEVSHVWVAQGTYVPKYTSLFGDIFAPVRMKSFSMINEIKIYGGFAGNEESVGERDWENNITILSGDIGIPGDKSDNAFHVVVAAGEIGSACLDGFTVKDGNANVNGESMCIDEISFAHCFGGGIYVRGSSVLLENLIVRENEALAGGGLYLTFCNSLVRNVSVINNSADNDVAIGGGIFTNFSAPVIMDSKINENTAKDGGGIFAQGDCNVTLQNVEIADNSCTYNGGGLFLSQTSYFTMRDATVSRNKAGNGGGLYYSSGANKIINTRITENEALNGAGIYSYSQYTSSELVNVLLANNTATGKGGAIYTANQDYSILTNVTMVDNSAPQGEAMFFTSSSAQVRNSIIHRNNTYTSGGTISYFYSSVENVTVEDSNGNLDGGLNPYLDGDYRLSIESPCIDRGNPVYIAGITSFDLDGNMRVRGNNIDLGAFESEYSANIEDYSATRNYLEDEISENNTGWDLNIYPNPVAMGQNTAISLGNQYSYYEKNVKVELYDIAGKNLYSQSYSTGNIELNTQQLKPGTYIVKIYTEEREVFTEKIIIKN